MNFINNLTSLFKYEEKKDYNFLLYSNGEKEQNESYSYENENLNTIKKVNSLLSNNLEFMKIKYNSLINSDIVFREFSIYVKNIEYKAFIIFIDGLVDSASINDFVIRPLMMRNDANTFDNNNLNSHNVGSGSRGRVPPLPDNKQKIIVKKNIHVIVKKKTTNSGSGWNPPPTLNDNINNGLSDYILNHLIPKNDIKKKQDFSDIISGINSGNCALFVNTLDFAFDIDVKKFKERSVSSPQNEIVIKGPQEAFVENIRTNTSLLRRSVNNENLIIENIEVGNLSKTKCGICYLKNVANSSLVEEVKFRINNLDIDSLISTGQLEQLIEDANSFGIPKVLSTERPDKCTKALFDGKVIVLVNGNPYALIMPGTFIDFISSPEDTNLRPQFANFLKSIRLIALVTTLLLPSLWIAITTFHQELIPTDLLFSIVASRENVPFPVVFEIILMELSFELLREASLRIPSSIGSTIGIVGALVLGDAAVSASIVSPILIIVIAITGIASFAIPDFSFGFHIRIMRFVFIIFGFLAGFLGIGLGIFIYICILCSLKSFGVSFMVPFAPPVKSNSSSYFVKSTFKQEKRPDYLNTKRPISQEHISMLWKKNGPKK